VSRHTHSRAARRPPVPTENQRAILMALFAGQTEEEIAHQTGRKPSTIHNTVRVVRQRFGARNGYDLMRECLRRGIVTLDEIYAGADAVRDRTAGASGEVRG
jgi:DNA-binding NarL/FixJ family response regulator